jgi:peptide/nickel transport system substrate-binding protein
LSTVLRRFPSAVACTALLAVLAGACRSPQSANPATTGAASLAPKPGGTLTVSSRIEPRSFSRLASRDNATALVTELTQARLVRVNKVTDEVEPWLAERWDRSSDGRRYTLALRHGVVFSDGQPFTADDVVFTFAAIYDKKTGSYLADSLQANGKRLAVRAVDPYTVELSFAEPFAAGVRLLDNLPILPRHVLGPALEAGTLADAWNLSTQPSQVVGLGPFVLARYEAGQRLIFDRNPHYFRKAGDGATLPYLDHVQIEIVPDQNAELLRLEAGQIDMTMSEVAPEAYAPLKRAADEGRVKLTDLGPGYDANSLWFNLKPGAFGDDPRAVWLQRDELRQAISLAVDRTLFASTVYLGAAAPAWGPITEGNKKWYWQGQPQEHDPEQARRLVQTIAHGQSPRFTLITQKGRVDLERGATVIRDELKTIGVTVDVVPMDGSALVQRFVSGKFEAVYFSALATDTDPALNPDFWFSGGSAHLWNMSEKTPATDWERRIDELMARQIATPDEAERKRLFDQVQQVFAEHQPVVYFAAPRIYVAYASRVRNVTPAVSRPQLLWSPDMLAVAQ